MTDLRIVTYNVRRCLGMDGRLSPQRIADVLYASKPDIVALQELDVGRLRSEGVDQARMIADALNMQFHFHPAMKVFEELYGDAILTSRPSQLVKAGALPGGARTEPRGALWVRIQIDGQPLDVINTHLGMSNADRLLQAGALLGPDWIGHVSGRPRLILTGDFNAIPPSRAYRRLALVLDDAQKLAGPPAATFPSRFPMLRLDHFFVGPGIRVISTSAITSPLARLASDHLPLTMDFALRSAAIEPAAA